MNPQLDLALTAGPAPKVKAHEVRAVVTVLRNATDKAWMKADAIAAEISKTHGDEMGKTVEAIERKVRRIASVSAPTVVSYPGSPGYRFWNYCTVEQIERCIDSLESQGKDMIKRAHVYRMAYYKQHREPVESAADQSRLALAG